MLSNGVVAAIRDALIRYVGSDDRCAIITGAGDRAFSAGADLNDPPVDPELWECMPGVGVDVDKPIIAAVAGYCVGGENADRFWVRSSGDVGAGKAGNAARYCPISRSRRLLMKIVRPTPPFVKAGFNRT